MMPAVSSTPARPASDLSRWAALASLLALIALGVLWESLLAPTGRGTLVVKVLPLVLGVWGVARARLYTFRWLSLVVWLYFIEGVVRAWGERGLGAALAGLEIALSLALFAACALHVRQRLHEAKAAPSQPDVPDAPAIAAAPTGAPR